MVGATGFEPATTCPPCRCATRLRYAPTGKGRSIYASARAAASGAGAPSGLPGSILRPALLEPIGQLLQLGLHLVQHQPPLGVVESDLDLRCGLLAFVEQRATGAGDGVAPVVEQLADAQQQLDLVGTVPAVPRPVLARAQHAALG